MSRFEEEARRTARAQEQRLAAVERQNRIAMLTKLVFTSPDGKELLKLWREQYVEQPIFSKDITKMAGLAANADFINHIIKLTRGNNNAVDI